MKTKNGPDMKPDYVPCAVTTIFCIAGLVRVVGRRSDGVERKARVGEAGSVASGVGQDQFFLAGS